MRLRVRDLEARSFVEPPSSVVRRDDRQANVLSARANPIQHEGREQRADVTAPDVGSYPEADNLEVSVVARPADEPDRLPIAPGKRASTCAKAPQILRIQTLLFRCRQKRFGIGRQGREANIAQNTPFVHARLPDDGFGHRQSVKVKSHSRRLGHGVGGMRPGV